jgi:hypothetical protein
MQPRKILERVLPLCFQRRYSSVIDGEEREEEGSFVAESSGWSVTPIAAEVTSMLAFALC